MKILIFFLSLETPYDRLTYSRPLGEVKPHYYRVAGQLRGSADPLSSPSSVPPAFRDSPSSTSTQEPPRNSFGSDSSDELNTTPAEAALVTPCDNNDDETTAAPPLLYCQNEQDIRREADQDLALSRTQSMADVEPLDSATPVLPPPEPDSIDYTFEVDFEAAAAACTASLSPIIEDFNSTISTVVTPPLSCSPPDASDVTNNLLE